MIEEKDLTVSILSDKIEELLFDKDKLSRMSECMKSLAIVDSEDKIYAELKKLLEK
jgi:UDP-N-acetylglucosamine:LPS N-acetylglucosamine transferase